MARGSARRRAVSERVATGIAAARKEFIGDCAQSDLVESRGFCEPNFSWRNR